MHNSPATMELYLVKDCLKDCIRLERVSVVAKCAAFNQEKYNRYIEILVYHIEDADLKILNGVRFASNANIKNDFNTEGREPSKW